MVNFSVYLNKVVKIDISRGLYFIGEVLSVDENFISLEDKRGHLVTISIKDILNIREVGE